LQVLEKEIKEESKYNAEGVALEMAIQEREWIETNFGVGGRPGALETSNLPTLNSVPLTPSSPLSPTGGRKLSEKLKGLKLGTSEKDLIRKPTGTPAPEPSLHPLSPEGPDVAISSFHSFHNTPISTPPQRATRHAVALAPPPHIQAQQQSQTALSMSFVASQQSTDSGDELFAKALSPRSPDIPRSPFSFSLEETMPYAMRKVHE